MCELRNTCSSNSNAPTVKLRQTSKFLKTLFFNERRVLLSNNLNKMPAQHFKKLLILDFGYPMDKNTTEVIKLSLQNVIALMNIYSVNPRLRAFGISIVNSICKVITYSNCFYTYYNEIIESLNSLYSKVIF